MKALQWLSEHMGIATEEQKAKIEMMRVKTAGAAGNANEVVDDWIEAVTEAGNGKSDNE